MPLIMMWVFTLRDLFHRRYMSGWVLALWLIFIIFFPVIGVIVYWITVPSGITAPWRTVDDW